MHNAAVSTIEWNEFRRSMGMASRRFHSSFAGPWFGAMG
jgi:hypothetical protein